MNNDNMLEEQIIEDIKQFANEKQAQHSKRYFKTGKGEYAEGDLFYGLNTPQVKSVVKKYLKEANLDVAEKLLKNPYHEVRTVSLLLMVELYDKADKSLKEKIYKTYIKNAKYINNWDLVDISCYKIVGKHIFNTKNYDDIYRLADSNHLWSERISVVSQYYLIKRNDFSLIIELSEKFLTHKHDLMHKACGWMLREVGKADESALCAFLDKYKTVMPRTMLRYSIEKFSKEKKLDYMKKN